MKIGIVCYPTYGGSGVVATELGIGLASKGHQVHFVTYKKPARLKAFYPNISFHEVDSMEYPLFDYPPYESSLASTLVDVVRYNELDILHVHYAIPHAAVAFMTKAILREEGIFIPVVTTLHGTDITLVGQDPTFKPIVQFSINQSDGVTAVSKYLRDTTYQSFDVKKEIEVIYNFIDFNRFRKSNKDHFKKALAPEGEKILVHISNFRKVKRSDEVIRVFQKVNKHIPSKLLMVGDGPERPNLENLCREIGLCSEIKFLGKQDAIEELLAVSDLFILPSGQESFGLAALEAMACEVPVISSNAGGLPEVNINGLTGYMSDIGDVESMAANALKILSDENVLSTMRNNALEQAQKFNIEYILPQYEAFYEKLITATKEKQML